MQFLLNKWKNPFLLFGTTDGRVEKKGDRIKEEWLGVYSIKDQGMIKKRSIWYSIL